MYFIAGITGQVGGAAARLLLQQGQQLRALVRDPTKAEVWAAQGVDVRRGDFNRPSELAAALEGVTAAYLMMPPVLTPSPGFPEAKLTAESYRAALAQTLPGRLVLLSSVGSEKPSGLGNIMSTSIMEAMIGNLPVPTAIVRAGSFLENYGWGLAAADRTGFFDTFLSPTTKPVPMIATADIGKQIAGLLVSEWTGKRIVELGTLVTPDALAAAMGQALGKAVTARAIPRDQWATSLERSGTPKGSTWAFEEMQDAFNSSWISFGVAGSESVAGTITPAEFFARPPRA